MTAKDFIEFYQQYCEARGWILTRAQWMQLDVIARGMGILEYHKFIRLPEGSFFESILEHLDGNEGVEILGIA